MASVKDSLSAFQYALFDNYGCVVGIGLFPPPPTRHALMQAKGRGAATARRLSGCTREDYETACRIEFEHWRSDWSEKIIDDVRDRRIGQQLIESNRRFLQWVR